MAMQIVRNTLTVIGGAAVLKTSSEQTARAQNKAYELRKSNIELQNQIYQATPSGSAIEQRIKEINCSPMIDWSQNRVGWNKMDVCDKIVWYLYSPIYIPFAGISLARQSFIQWKIKRIEREWKDQLLDELLRDAKKIK